MKIVLSSTTKFHIFDPAREFERRGVLACIFSGYPRWKLRDEHLPPSKIRLFSWLFLIYNVIFRLTTNRWLRWEISWLCNQGRDAFTAALLPPCDVFMAI
jgi:starch synthase